MGKKGNAIIIGAGIGGITTAIYLARQGFSVVIHEKNAAPGGRCGNIVKNGHRFDIGATLLMMPDIYEKTFAAMDRRLEDELQLFRMEPVYKIKYKTGELLFSSDLVKLQMQLEHIEPGSYKKFLRYMDESYRSYKLSMSRIIDTNYYSAFDFFNFKNAILLFRLKAFRNHNKVTSEYFKNDLLRIAFSFQNIYVGQNPYEASAIFSMLPFLELTEGVWFPKGGMYRIIERLVSIAEDNGVELHLKSPVKEIKTNHNKAEGVMLNDGSWHPADVIVANADLPYVYNNLLPDKNNLKRLRKLHYTCSAILFHWGMDTVYPQLEQHSVFVSDSYKESIKSIFNGEIKVDDPSFYVHAPVRSDITAAPEGQDSISVIVPVGNISGDREYDWDTIKSEVRNAILRRLLREGMSDFEKHIKFEVCYTPHSWLNQFNLSRGATFGSLSHNLLQMGYMRPHNQHRKFRNLFFAGGSTHPGNGIPLSLLSAKLTSEKIERLF